MHIDHISVLDNHQSALSITGDLAIHERQVGGVQLFVTADDFKVIDNKLGNVRLNSDLEIAGELRSPRIEGDLGVTTGHVNLDEIIAHGRRLGVPDPGDASTVTTRHRRRTRRRRSRRSSTR